MVPVRTCVGCRQRAEQGDVVRFVLRDAQVILDAEASMPGRGAWLHPHRECFDAALKRRAFARAFRQPAQTAGLSFEQIEVVSLKKIVHTR